MKCNVLFVLTATVLHFKMALCWNFPSEPEANGVSAERSHTRIKRSFFITNGTRLRFKPKLTIPVPSYSSLVDAKVKIYVPVIDYFVYTGFGISGRSPLFDQQSLFRYFENGLSSWGLDGQMCLLRAMCEIGDLPNHSLGLLGDVVDILLKVKSEDEDLKKYRKAEEYGRYYGRCSDKFFSCPLSIFNLPNML
ncbi:Uncharacterised protein at_DN2224 [Pycnogonum litorale]